MAADVVVALLRARARRKLALLEREHARILGVVRTIEFGLEAFSWYGPLCSAPLRTGVEQVYSVAQRASSQSAPLRREDGILDCVLAPRH